MFTNARLFTKKSLLTPGLTVYEIKSKNMYVQNVKHLSRKVGMKCFEMRKGLELIVQKWVRVFHPEQ